MFNRGELCTLAGITLDAYKSMERRDQLPFDDLKFDRRHRKFTSRHALSLACVVAFAKSAGLDLDYSKSVVVNGLLYLFSSYSIERPFQDLWLGAVRWSDRDCDGRFHVGGSLIEITRNIDKDRDRAADYETPGYRQTAVHLLNVSSIFNEVKGRASEASIPFPARIESIHEFDEGTL